LKKIGELDIAKKYVTEIAEKIIPKSDNQGYWALVKL
jgi:hypothetical protein